MKLENRFLRSKVGRRIFLLFVSCALLPIVALSAICFGFVTQHLKAQSRWRLHDAAKAMGMEIVSRLDLAGSDLRMAATLLGGGDRDAAGLQAAVVREHFSSRFRSLALIGEPAPVLPVFGAPEDFPRSSEFHRSHLTRDDTVLVVDIAPDGTPRTLLGRQADACAGEDCWLVGEIRPEFLWGGRQMLGSMEGKLFVVLDDRRQPLFSSLDDDGAQLPADLAGMLRGSSGEFRWTHRDRDYLSYRWSLYLEPSFGAGSWTVVLGELRADVLAPLAKFTRLLPLVILFCLLLVVWLSFVQVNRSLVPLERLQQGTLLIAEKRFETRVTVSSGDEFEQLADSFNSMAGGLARLVANLETMNQETLRALATAVDANSPWTAGHSERVTELTLRLARQLRVSEEEMLVLHKGGLLHDIGKIGVSNEILDKPDGLTDEEFTQIKDHVTIGARILRPISGYAEQIPIVLYHHERYDGSGYPEGLAGAQIPWHARILSVADVFDALISERPYRASWKFERVVEYLRCRAGIEFDPRVVAAFLELEAQGLLPGQAVEQPLAVNRP